MYQPQTYPSVSPRDTGSTTAQPPPTPAINSVNGKFHRCCMGQSEVNFLLKYMCQI